MPSQAASKNDGNLTNSSNAIRLEPLAVLFQRVSKGDPSSEQLFLFGMLIDVGKQRLVRSASSKTRLERFEPLQQIKNIDRYSGDFEKDFRFESLTNSGHQR